MGDVNAMNRCPNEHFYLDFQIPKWKEEILDLEEANIQNFNNLSSLSFC